MTMKQSTVSMRIRIENLCIGIIFLFSLMLFALNFFHRSSAEAVVLISVIDLLLLAAFLCFRRDFCCPAAPKDRKRSLYVLLLSVLGVLANAAKRRGLLWRITKSAAKRALKCA